MLPGLVLLISSSLMGFLLVGVGLVVLCYSNLELRFQIKAKTRDVEHIPDVTRPLEWSSSPNTWLVSSIPADLPGFNQITGRIECLLPCCGVVIAKIPLSDGESQDTWSSLGQG